MILVTSVYLASCLVINIAGYFIGDMGSILDVILSIAAVAAAAYAWAWKEGAIPSSTRVWIQAAVGSLIVTTVLFIIILAGYGVPPKYEDFMKEFTSDTTRLVIFYFLIMIVITLVDRINYWISFKVIGILIKD